MKKDFPCVPYAFGRGQVISSRQSAECAVAGGGGQGDDLWLAWPVCERNIAVLVYSTLVTECINNSRGVKCPLSVKDFLNLSHCTILSE